MKDALNLKKNKKKNITALYIIISGVLTSAAVGAKFSSIVILSKL